MVNYASSFNTYQRRGARPQSQATVKVKILFSILFCILVFLNGCRPDRTSVANDMLIGDQIVAALEKYKAQRGSYPDVLSELEPNYIGHITVPRYGEQKWSYVHYCKNDSFGLAMWGKRLTDDGYVYSSERKQWETAENSF
jgi:hypothetical protein